MDFEEIMRLTEDRDEYDHVIANPQYWRHQSKNRNSNLVTGTFSELESSLPITTPFF